MKRITAMMAVLLSLAASVTYAQEGEFRPITEEIMENPDAAGQVGENGDSRCCRAD